MDDLRDIRGRLAHLAIASLIGIVVAITLALVIPDPEHCRLFTCFPQRDGRAISLVVIGAATIALAVYSLFRRFRRG